MDAPITLRGHIIAALCHKWADPIAAVYYADRHLRMRALENAKWSGAEWVGVLGPVLDDPGLNVVLVPDAAHPQLSDGRRESVGRGELRDALTAEAPESLCDLCGTHVPGHNGQHRQHPSRHLPNMPVTCKGRHLPSPTADAKAEAEGQETA